MYGCIYKRSTYFSIDPNKHLFQLYHCFLIMFYKFLDSNKEKTKTNRPQPILHSIFVMGVISVNPHSSQPILSNLLN